jgi:hypothetical protein
MARNDDNATPARFGTLHELLTRAEALGAHTVQLNIHDVPTATALEWLQLGLLDAIEPGAGSNPPTGTMEAGDHTTGRTTAIVFTDGPRLSIEEREAAIARVAEELATNTALLDELKRHEDEEVA